MSIIVVTGGAGFIGSNLLAGLEARGARADLVVCDVLGTGAKWRNVAKREIADIVPPAKLIPFLDAHRAGVEAVFHLGANSSTVESDVDQIVQANARFTLDLFDWCTHAGRRLIYASSAATYGGGDDFDDAFGPQALARLRPLNPYGWSKHLVDRRIARLIAEGKPRPPQWAGLKFFNVYGPNEYHKDGQRSVVHQVFEAARDGRPARLFRSTLPGLADGEQKRDFVWVEDCVQVMLWLLDTPAASGLFNLGSGRAASFNALAGAVFSALGRAPDIAYVDMPEAVRAHYQNFTEARMDRLRDAGYHAPFTPVQEGVRRYVQDYLLAQDPYR